MPFQGGGHPLTAWAGCSPVGMDGVGQGPHCEVVLPHADCRDTEEEMEVDVVVILEQMMEVDEEEC